MKSNNDLAGLESLARINVPPQGTISDDYSSIPMRLAADCCSAETAVAHKVIDQISDGLVYDRKDRKPA